MSQEITKNTCERKKKSLYMPWFLSFCKGKDVFLMYFYDLKRQKSHWLKAVNFIDLGSK